uniref:Glycine-rich protein n=1 Tax=Fagus sylvatica TaxID=28930 RepID=A0A2N9HNY7_FAGSY
MQGGRGGRGDPFFNFGDPFAGFGGFGGFGDHRSLLSNMFGGRDPFDDPFFTRPFGGMFDTSLFGSSGSPFMNMHPSGFLEHQAPEPKRPRGPIIEELNSDSEKDVDKETKENPRKHGRSSSECYVEDPDDEVEEKKSKHLLYRNDDNRLNHTQSQSQSQSQPQARHFTFQSSAVTYGGADGPYYTSSRTRRTGSDGVTVDEAKEADIASRQASHRISRGIHNKGHSVATKLNSDGKVDTMQMLHNLNEDELPGFEEAWKGNAQQHLPGWSENLINYGGSSSGHGQAGRGGWALPSTEQAQHSGRVIPDGRHRGGSTRSEFSGRMKSDVRDRSVHSRGKGRN